MANTFTIRDFEQADSKLRAAQSRRHFYIHTILYAVTNVVLIVLNLMLGPTFPWALLPVVLWGIALTGHYLVAIRRVRSANEQWMAQVESLAEELHRANEIQTVMD
jgi:uncharacterized membrane protein YhaH (DUF805 family)